MMVSLMDYSISDEARRVMEENPIVCDSYWSENGILWVFNIEDLDEASRRKLFSGFGRDNR